MFELVAEADSVELKLTVPGHRHQRSTIAALGMDPLDAQIRQVFFFDTPDLAARTSAGVVVRARRVQGKGDDSVVKLRPVVRTSCRRTARRRRTCKVEVDAMPGGYVCSASLKGTLGDDRRPEHVVGGHAPLQEALLQGAARVLRRARARGDRAGRPGGARPDLRAQAEVHAEGRRAASSSPSCGCTRTARGSSSCRPSARRPTLPRSPPRARRS